ncbi:hypothetical protein AU476_36800 [Cupriavidus sp. UYMSc13B]|nr:hypothetical protein AU476_36800 [Cupriavidus sp. UYMSc13B]
MNASNHPLSPTITLNLQDQYVGRNDGLGDEDGNSVLLRGTRNNLRAAVLLCETHLAGLPDVSKPYFGGHFV